MHDMTCDLPMEYAGRRKPADPARIWKSRSFVLYTRYPILLICIKKIKQSFNFILKENRLIVLSAAYQHLFTYKGHSIQNYSNAPSRAAFAIHVV